MKRWIAGFLFFATMVLGSSSAFAQMPIKQAGNFGIGLGVGTTAAPISLKYFLADNLSLQGNAGWWRGWGWGNCSRYGCGYYREALGLSGDILVEGGPITGNADLSLDWEAGGGVGIGVGGSRYGGFGLAVAGVVGLQLNIHALPIDLVVEYRPSIYLLPDFAWNLVDFTGHIRYYF